jgi:hypothetical protein
MSLFARVLAALIGGYFLFDLWSRIGPVRSISCNYRGVGHATFQRQQERSGIGIKLDLLQTCLARLSPAPSGRSDALIPRLSGAHKMRQNGPVWTQRSRCRRLTGK